AAILVTLFLMLALRGIKIAKNAPDMFGRLMATGITVWIIMQAFINIGANIALIPLTGIPLPFISYGGTSLVFLLSSIGILLNISKQSNLEN
ncbi:MAG: Cell division protein FtsW, partial [Parcubacteria group bacterium GW2011_GWC1_38_22]